jgi:hypothetical protein
MALLRNIMYVRDETKGFESAIPFLLSEPHEWNYGKRFRFLPLLLPSTPIKIL